jgi:hypothetical protein
MSDNITTVTSSEVEETEGQTDWDRLEEMSDEEITQAVEEDPDQEILDEEWFERAHVRPPRSGGVTVPLDLDAQTLQFFFDRSGEDYQEDIREVLLEYVRTMRLEQRRQEIQNVKERAERDLRWAQQLAAHSESKEEDEDAESQRGNVVDDD